VRRRARRRQTAAELSDGLIDAQHQSLEREFANIEQVLTR
jgi:hypothetical protein